MVTEKAHKDAVALRRELGYIDEKATAGVIGVTVPTLRNRSSAGTAPPRYKLGKNSVYKVAEVQAFISRRRVAKAPA
jgi:predicted DNA-binding transcriptional regulator AlpA